MSFGYRLWLERPVFEFLVTLRSRERKRLLEWLDQLAARSPRTGDFVERRERRECQVSVVGQYSICWWADHAVCEIKVLEIRLADL